MLTNSRYKRSGTSLAFCGLPCALSALGCRALAIRGLLRSRGLRRLVRGRLDANFKLSVIANDSRAIPLVRSKISDRKKTGRVQLLHRRQACGRDTISVALPLGENMRSPETRRAPASTTRATHHSSSVGSGYTPGRYPNDPRFCWSTTTSPTTSRRPAWPRHRACLQPGPHRLTPPVDAHHNRPDGLAGRRPGWPAQPPPEGKIPVRARTAGRSARQPRPPSRPSR